MESRLFDEFKRCGVQYTEFNTEDESNWYYAMQHHGGPTRLLDWSDGSLMAATSACGSKSARAISNMTQLCMFWILIGW